MIVVSIQSHFILNKVYFGSKTYHSRCHMPSQNPYKGIVQPVYHHANPRINKGSTPTRQVKIRTETLFDMSHPGSSGRCRMTSLRASWDDDRSEVSSHPSRIDGHVEPACNWPSYNSIKAPGRHSARGEAKKKKNSIHYRLTRRRGQSRESPDESHFCRKAVTHDPRASQPWKALTDVPTASHQPASGPRDVDQDPVARARSTSTPNSSGIRLPTSTRGLDHADSSVTAHLFTNNSNSDLFPIKYDKTQRIYRLDQVIWCFGFGKLNLIYLNLSYRMQL